MSKQGKRVRHMEEQKQGSNQNCQWKDSLNKQQDCSNLKTDHTEILVALDEVIFLEGLMFPCKL